MSRKTLRDGIALSTGRAPRVTARNTKHPAYPRFTGERR